jgi:GrpB-like predicted nucleotidyltransferase (UPF0157 family)
VDPDSAALASRALAVEHIGSTAVPGLAAKPIIDVLVTVEDLDDEAGYAGALEAAGFPMRGPTRRPWPRTSRCATTSVGPRPTGSSTRRRSARWPVGSGRT